MFWQLNCILIFKLRAYELFEMELFLKLKLYLH